MKAFEVSGQFKISKYRWQTFSIEVASEHTDAAKEKVMSLLGSRHRTPRRLIKIEKVEELKPAEIKDAYVRYQVGAEN